ncbi:unnamed protein product, partial [Laminaria digitata]
PTLLFVPAGACNPNPCENGGSCSADPAGGPVCTCASDFGGMTCQLETSCKHRQCQRFDKSDV